MTTKNWDEIREQYDTKTVEGVEQLLRDHIPSLMLYKITIHAPRYGGYGARTLETNNEDDAIELAYTIVTALRARLGDEHRDDHWWNSWRVDVTASICTQHGMDDWHEWRLRKSAGISGRYVAIYESGKARVAHPDARVFFSFWSRDCDGVAGTDVYEAPDFVEAHKLLDECFKSVEGAHSWSCISREQFEQYIEG